MKFGTRRAAAQSIGRSRAFGRRNGPKIAGIQRDTKKGRIASDRVLRPAPGLPPGSPLHSAPRAHRPFLGIGRAAWNPSSSLSARPSTFHSAPAASAPLSPTPPFRVELRIRRIPAEFSPPRPLKPLHLDGLPFAAPRGRDAAFVQCFCNPGGADNAFGADSLDERGQILCARKTEFRAKAKSDRLAAINGILRRVSRADDLAGAEQRLAAVSAAPPPEALNH
jgi:hypothetical protein